MLEGELAFTIDGVERVVAAGGCSLIPPGVPHSARPLGACRALMVDQPPRAEVGGVKIPAAVPTIVS